MFVKVDHPFYKTEDFIEKVRFELHPTFKQNIRWATKAEKFQLSSIGWGTFDIPIKIIWHKNIQSEPKELEHCLSFEGNGLTAGFAVKVQKSLLPQNRQIQPPQQAKAQQPKEEKKKPIQQVKKNVPAKQPQKQAKTQNEAQNKSTKGNLNRSIDN